MKDDRILQLQGEAHKAGKTLIIISEETIVMEGQGRKLVDIIGTAFLNLRNNNEFGGQLFLTGCGSVVYAAAMNGMLDDVQVDQLYEALAIAKAQRANKQGREN